MYDTPKDIQQAKFIQAIAAFPWVEQIVLFGSRANSTHRERSDIDIAVACPAAGVLEWQKVLDIVESADTLLKIDCVRLDDISDAKFLSNIKNNQAILYERKN